MNEALAIFRKLVAEAVPFWVSGGWGMTALALNGLVIYGLGMTILLKLWSKGLYANAERAWRRSQRDPDRVRGAVGEVLRAARACRTLEETEHFFAGLLSDELGPFERDLRVMRVSVSTAPLLGLLGTVTGMLTTFNALARGGGGDKTMGMIAGGISEALITTETGLVLALSGMMFQYALTRQHERYAKLVVHLETLCTQAQRRRDVAAAAA